MPCDFFNKHNEEYQRIVDEYVSATEPLIDYFINGGGGYVMEQIARNAKDLVKELQNKQHKN